MEEAPKSVRRQRKQERGGKKLYCVFCQKSAIEEVVGVGALDRWFASECHAPQQFFVMSRNWLGLGQSVSPELGKLKMLKHKKYRVKKYD